MTKRFFLLVLLVLSLSASCSGMIEQPGFVSIFLGNDERLILKEFEQSQNNEIGLVFEGAVSDLQVYALKENNPEEILCTVEKVEAAESFSAFKIRPSKNFTIGEDFKICGKVSGGMSQILDFELPFKGANTKPAELSFSSMKLGSTSKPGFIKFDVKSDGNLFGIKLVNAGNSKEPDFAFPAFEVKAGNIIVFYWFLPSDGSEPEDGILVSAESCAALEAGEKAFCFWGRLQKFQPKRTNAVLIREPKTEALQDAVLFRHPKDEDWGVNEIENAVLEAVAAGLWKPDGDILNAVQANISPAKMLKRLSYEKINRNAEDWTLTK
ncbi:hypothetical protein E4O00_11270 [Treponema sp. OMZ 788]|uniref:hypothetical protein n=1 Tax=unclassified Treponema TaxID=2638727 RepID=UPI0020A4AC61|nr:MULTISPECIES: hypothetical protein [unclassified Treponema]UTC62751.1 hypothetical protein E4O05_02295 [Treponema sp. OMZ 787]UTC64372.1 hypothetical protein E4O00_11270 [Treponema sp. OMZ 788]